MRFIIFGIGKFYYSRKWGLRSLCGDFEMVLFFDNRADEIGFSFEGKEVKKPCMLPRACYDKVLLMSLSSNEMREQLIRLGYQEEDIWDWNQFEAEMSHGRFQFYCGMNRQKKRHRRILILTKTLGYHGGPISIVNAAKCLSENNEVLIAAPNADMKFVREMKDNGLNILIYKSFPIVDREERYLFEGFDIAIVNIFPMLPVAVQLSEFMPVLWWIHENSDDYDTAYGNTRRSFSEYDDIEKMKWMRIMAVSDIAKKNFELYYPSRIDGIMTFGIPDDYCIVTDNNTKHEKTIFAVIGGICERKGQLVLAKSLEYIAQSDRQKMEIWLIGQCFPSSYFEEVRNVSEKYPEIKILGVMDRKRLREVFVDIDVILCPSLEETMSITVVEGLMNRKICVATDKTGISEYITDGINGFVCEAGNAEAFARVIERILHNKDRMESIKENARKTYEEYFAMEEFADRLNKEIEVTLKNYYQWQT